MYSYNPLFFHILRILIWRTTCHTLLLLCNVIMNYKHLGCIMDTLHYQDKHNSLCILPKATQAVTLNLRAACLTRPTDVEQKHALALPLKSRNFTRILHKCYMAQMHYNKQSVKPAAICLVSLFCLEFHAYKCALSTRRLLSIKHRQSRLGESDGRFSESRTFFMPFSPDWQHVTLWKWQLNGNLVCRFIYLVW